MANSAVGKEAFIVWRIGRIIWRSRSRTADAFTSWIVAMTLSSLAV